MAGVCGDSSGSDGHVAAEQTGTGRIAGLLIDTSGSRCRPELAPGEPEVPASNRRGTEGGASGTGTNELRCRATHGQLAAMRRTIADSDRITRTESRSPAAPELGSRPEFALQATGRLLEQAARDRTSGSQRSIRQDHPSGRTRPDQAPKSPWMARTLDRCSRHERSLAGPESDEAMKTRQ